MVTDKYSLYSGRFICHHCKEDVDSARFWKDTLDLTWQCSKRHISKVVLDVRGY